MPLLGARSASTKFKGKYDSVKKFICQYKQMCMVYNILNAEKYQHLVDYCLSRVTRFIKALDSFVDEDWAQLEMDILTYYDAELNESRYLISNINRLIDHWYNKGIFNLQKFKEYEVEFLTIVNWLLHKGKIMQAEQHTKFWYGLHGNLREIVEARHMTTHPRYDPRNVIPREDIAKILKELLKMTMSDDKSSSEEEDSYESDSDDKSHYSEDRSDNESDKEDKHRKQKKRNKHEKDMHWKEKLEEKGKSKAKEPALKEDTLKEEAADEVEELVGKLLRMKVSDTDYAQVYYRALKKDSKIANIIALPIQCTGAIFPPMQRMNPTPPPTQF
ncbi:hypothetical protein ARMGADRAFT_940535 [Armillaria gallica]|uniref:Uncharacterized protein n=1 Tax=Armillaria gallica TaxID=47427 RepID=A0A2H3CY25_ARMGA|nr:hypothetical protein ARMGADRAFT_940535 [Armillaria gallica]